jgi:hypothetical protein
MTTTVLNLPTIGIEAIQRAAFVQLFADLNPALAQMSLYMTSSDEQIAALTGIPYEPTSVEPIVVENFYEGHRPSLINAPIEKYPNCAVMANQATPGVPDLIDQADAYRCVLAVEIMVKSYENEGTTNRRVQRTAEAVNVALMKDQTLGGAVASFDAPPVVVIGDLFVRKERTSYGPEWYWQGARLEYAIRKEASRPSATEATLPAFEIDQT